jgi:HEAT repeat protein
MKMDISEYRKQYEEQLKRAAGPQDRLREVLDRSKSAADRVSVLESPASTEGPDTVSEAINVARNKDEDLQLRIEALDGISIEVGENHDLIDIVLGLVSDESEPPLLRRATLRLLQQSSFRTILFQPKRAEYLAVLRKIIDDQDAQLRLPAIEILAVAKDEYLQRRLIEGLQDPALALVPPEKALEFLSYDVHAEYYPILREIIENPPSLEAKREAVRLLSSDPTATDVLVHLLRDKGEDEEVRKISAAALQTVAPGEFEAQARQIVLDDEEDDDLRAISISALDYFGDKERLSHDEAFIKQIEQLGSRQAGELESSPTELQRAADRFISRKRQ